MKQILNKSHLQSQAKQVTPIKPGHSNEIAAIKTYGLFARNLRAVARQIIKSKPYHQDALAAATTDQFTAEDSAFERFTQAHRIGD